MKLNNAYPKIFGFYFFTFIESSFKSNNMNDRQIKITEKKDEILDCLQNFSAQQNQFTSACKSIILLVNDSKLKENHELLDIYKQAIIEIYDELSKMIDEDIMLNDERNKLKIQGLIEITGKLNLQIKADNTVEKLRKKFTDKLNAYLQTYIDNENEELNETRINILLNIFSIMSKCIDDKSKAKIEQLQRNVCKKFDTIEIEIQEFLKNSILVSFTPVQLKIEQSQLMTKLSSIPDVTKRHKKLKDNFETFKNKQVFRILSKHYYPFSK